MTLNVFYKKYRENMERAIRNALSEDKAEKDITTSLFLNKKADNKIILAELLCKEDCILAGLDIFRKVFQLLHPSISFKSYFKDGDRVRNKSVVLKVKSPLSVLLKGERTALNFLQRMSGIATLTNAFVGKLKFKGSKILHTRKTTPNFRLFELAAVKIGGGDFHRFDLSSSVLVKDNHIAAAGSIEKTMEKIRKKGKGQKKLEVEVKNLRELNAVIRLGKGIVKVVMLDNFNKALLPETVRILKKNYFKVELSGGINMKNFDEMQIKGIDYYSIGMLTHSYSSVDFSLEF